MMLTPSSQAYIRTKGMRSPSLLKIVPTNLAEENIRLIRKSSPIFSTHARRETSVLIVWMTAMTIAAILRAFEPPKYSAADARHSIYFES